ncbi:hypothetical protein DFH06DRAFT_1130037 [Mycena polygramma]|nr:hypothetical protein DFH06DRAFT_1130037 [Mycena polygramma]
MPRKSCGCHHEARSRNKVGDLSGARPRGFDEQFGTNVIGHFFLTELLLPALTKSCEESKVPARVPHCFGRARVGPGKWDRVREYQRRTGARRVGQEQRKLSVSTGTLSLSQPDALTWEARTSLVRGYSTGRARSATSSSRITSRRRIRMCWCRAHSIPGAYSQTSSGIMYGTRYALELAATSSTNPETSSMGAFTQLWGGTVALPAQITTQYLVPWGKVGTADKRVSNAKLEEELVAYTESNPRSEKTPEAKNRDLRAQICRNPGNDFW